MNNRDSERFSALTEAISAQYDKPFTPLLQQMYWDALAPYPIEAVENALLAHIRDPNAGMFFPKPAHLIRHMKADDRQQAIDAWTVVHNEVCRKGDSGGVFADTLIRDALRQMPGGYWKLCDTSSADMPKRKAEFIAIYRALSEGATAQPAIEAPKRNVVSLVRGIGGAA